MKEKCGVMAEMFYELLQGRGHALSGNLQIKDAIHIHIYDQDMNLWHGHIHLDEEDYMKRSMVWA